MDRWWVAEAWEHSPVFLVSWVVWAIGSIVLHELAHGWAAISRGDRTPIESGHMTWNPLVHMGHTSLILFALLGIAWGAMPVNPHRFRGRYDDALVAAAGPAMNLALAAVALGAYCLWVVFGDAAGSPLYGNLQTFLRLGIVLNIVLMLLNLLPIPPLDGSRILGNLIPSFERLWQGEQAQIAGLVAFAAVFFIGADYIWDAAFAITDHLTDAILTPLGYTKA